MKKTFMLILLTLPVTQVIFSQVSITADGSGPDNSAMLEVKSTDKGFLPPRMTHEQRDAITNPAEGLIVVCSDCSSEEGPGLTIFMDGKWRLFHLSCPIPVVNVTEHTPGVTEITWRWRKNAIADGYKIMLVPGDTNSVIDVGADTMYHETGLTCQTFYWKFVCGYNECSEYFNWMLLNQTTLSVPIESNPIEGIHSATIEAITWDWNTVPDATGYKWGNTGDYGAAIDVGNASAYLETGLNCGTSYTRYVWAFNSCGRSDSSVISYSTLTDPLPPVPATHDIEVTAVRWNWNALPGATGYKWSTSNDYAAALDIGPVTAKIETGLTGNTAYTRYLWAYCPCGHSTETILTAITLETWTCGAILGRDHIAGTVAPVDKTVVYETVNNIPGETSKCWITSNLGADHQATAVNENTEASAGWYWQFNRMQGYKHDGTNRTPDTWISVIDENTDWQTTNDPCMIEIGAGWRLPTYTEYFNCDNEGGWLNWNAPWNSPLKLHVAGFLSETDGAVYNRGYSGYYWSSTQLDNSYGGILSFSQYGNCNVYNFPKAMGFSIRCLKE